MLRYLRAIFLRKIGEKSKAGKDINALAKLYCKLFGRQSDRSIPPTAFSKGLRTTKLMAKEYRGILLIMLAVLHSSKGRRVLKFARGSKFKEDHVLDDWILLLEMVLQWEAYLCEPEMEVRHLKRLGKKHRYIMYCMRKVAQRTKGMGLKLMKFHGILHMVEDILLYGVPMEVDTGANESHHKPAKAASKLTQRSALTFNYQTATRLFEFQLIDLAMEEINNGGKVWEYYNERDDSSGSAAVDTSMEDVESERGGPETWTGETRIRIMEEEDGVATFKLISRSKTADQAFWNSDVLDFLHELQEKVRPYLGDDFLPIFTCHKRGGQIFRGHPHFRGGGPWKDWAWVNWGAGYGKLPCHIWCFVNLVGLQTTRPVLRHATTRLENMVYAVVETTTEETDEDVITKSDIFMPIRKEVDVGPDGTVTKRHFYLADSDALVDPCCAIPDLGGPVNWYFVVMPRTKWPEQFIKWVEDPHNLDDMKDNIEPSNEDNIASEEENEEELEGEESESDEE